MKKGIVLVVCSILATIVMSSCDIFVNELEKIREGRIQTCVDEGDSYLNCYMEEYLGEEYEDPDFGSVYPIGETGCIGVPIAKELHPNFSNFPYFVTSAHPSNLTDNQIVTSDNCPPVKNNFYTRTEALEFD